MIHDNNKIGNRSIIIRGDIYSSSFDTFYFPNPFIPITTTPTNTFDSERGVEGNNRNQKQKKPKKTKTKKNQKQVKTF
jgi:hypothetical protein